MTSTIILASGSTIRRTLLENAGISIKVEKPRVDETMVKRSLISENLSPRDISDEYLDDYIVRNGDRLLTTVGGYQIETEGIRLFSKITGDYFSILGLPLIEILNILMLNGALKT